MIPITPFRFDKDTIVIEPELLSYSEFKAVFDLTKDTELRLNYFKYIYHSSDERSIPLRRGFSEPETDVYAKKQAKLENTKIPDVVKIACEFYRETFISNVKELSINIQSTVRKQNKILNKINDSIDRVLEQTVLTPEKLAELVSLQNQIIKIAGQLPTQITMIQDVEKQIEKEDLEKEKGRGGIEISDSMMGDEQLEKYM